MPAPDNSRERAGALNQNYGQQRIAPSGDGSFQASSVGSVGGSGPTGIQIGQQARIKQTGAELYQALSGGLQGAAAGLKTYQDTFRAVSEERYADFQTAYVKEFERVDGSAEKMKLWIDNYNYKPNRVTAQRYHTLRAEVYGKAQDQYESDYLADLERRASLMTPDRRLQLYSDTMAQWDEDSTVWRALDATRTQTQNALTSANHEFGLERLGQQYKDQVDGLSKSLIDNGHISPEITDSAYYRRVMEAALLLDGTNGVEINVEQGAITVGGKSYLIGTELGPEVDVQLQALLSDYGASSFENNERLARAMAVSQPRLQEAAKGKMSMGEKDGLAAALLGSAFTAGASGGPVDTATFKQTIDRLVGPDGDTSAITRNLVPAILSDPDHTFRQKREALIAVDQLYDWESNKEWWTSRGYESEEAVRAARQRSGIDEAIESAALGEVNEIAMGVQSALTARPEGGNPYLADPRAMNALARDAYSQMLSTFSSVPNDVQVYVGGQAMSPVEFQEAVTRGDLSFDDSLEIFITPTEGSDFSESFRPGGQKPFVVAGDDVIIFGDPLDPIDPRIRAEIDRQVMAGQTVRARAMNMDRVLSEGYMANPGDRPLGGDAKDAMLFAVEIGDPRKALEVLQAPAYLGEPLITALNPDERTRVLNMLMQPVPMPNPETGEVEMVGISRQGIEDFLNQSQTPGASRVAMLAGLMNGNIERSNELRVALRESGLAPDKTLWMLTDGARIAREESSQDRPISARDLEAVYDYMNDKTFAVNDDFASVMDAVQRMAVPGSSNEGTSTSPVTAAALARISEAYAASHDLTFVEAVQSEDAVIRNEALDYSRSVIRNWQTGGAVVRAIRGSSTTPVNDTDLALQIIEYGSIVPQAGVKNAPVTTEDINHSTFDPAAVSSQGATRGRGIREHVADTVISQFAEVRLRSGGQGGSAGERAQAREAFRALVPPVRRGIAAGGGSVDDDALDEVLTAWANGGAQEAVRVLTEIFDGNETRARAWVGFSIKEINEHFSVSQNQAHTNASDAMPAENGYIRYPLVYNVKINDEIEVPAHIRAFIDRLSSSTMTLERIGIANPGSSATGAVPYAANDVGITDIPSRQQEQQAAFDKALGEMTTGQLMGP